MIVAVVRSRALPAVERAGAWLNERSRRERLLLLTLAVLGIAAVGWYGLLQPLLVARQIAVERIELYEGLQARLRATPANTAAAPVAVIMTGPLDEALRRAAAVHALSPDLVGDANRVAVTIGGARFDSAMAFVQALEGGGVVITELRLGAAGQPGLVNLTLTASRP